MISMNGSSESTPDTSPVIEDSNRTRYKPIIVYISAWCGWCINKGYLEAHYAQRASVMAPLPEDDGRKPGDQQA